MRNILAKFLLPAVTVGALLMATWGSVAAAGPDGHADQMQMKSERMHELIKARLDKLAERLEIKSSQQGAWEEFTKAFEPPAERNIKKSDENADAATVARNRAERAGEVAKRLNRIADATAKLQAVLTEDQRKILNQVSRRFMHKHHGWGEKRREQDHTGHEWNRRESYSGESQHEEHNKDAW